MERADEGVMPDDLLVEPSVQDMAPWHGPMAPVRRARLIGWFKEQGAARLTVVQAPAGYGKTATLMQWFEEADRAAWLTLRPEHRDPATLHRALAAALGRAGSGFIFLDNAWFPSDGRAAGCLRTFIDRAPRHVRFVVATRERLGIPLGRLRAAGQLVELGAEDLRFDSAEITSLLAGLGAPALTALELDALERRTEGWPVAIRLAAVALGRAEKPEALLETLSGEWEEISDFLEEEVLLHVSAHVRDFLLRTSVLDRLCPALCDHLAQSENGPRFLHRLLIGGLFLEPLDKQGVWFRYQRPFAEFLRRRLRAENPDLALMLHRRASDWLSRSGYHVEAYDHAIAAGDPLRAAEILDAHSVDVDGEKLEHRMIEMANKLPPEFVMNYPRISLATAWKLISSRQFEQARLLLAASRSRLSEMRRSGSLSADELSDLENLLLHRETMLALFQDDIQPVQKQCERLIREYGNARPVVKASFYVSLIKVQADHFKFGEIELFDGLARDQLRGHDYSTALAVLDSATGPARFNVGRIDTAIRSLTDELARAVKHGRSHEQVAAISAMPLARFHYERNEIDRAAELIDRYLPVAADLGFVDGIISGYLTRARLLGVGGDIPAAIEALDLVAAHPADGGYERAKMLLGSERIRLLARLGQYNAAIRAAEAIGLQCSHASVLPVGRVTVRDEARAMGWVRIALAKGLLADGIKVARQWRSFVAAAQATRSQIRWSVLLASLLASDGQIRAAHRALREAIVLAAPGRYLRSFLDEGPAIGSIMLDHPPLAAGLDDRAIGFANELIAEFSGELCREAVDASDVMPENTEGPVGVLTARESEVLAMVGIGLRNREIGEKLGMTEATVKWYLQQLFDKLGTRRRVQAVAKARKLGLIAA